MPAGTTKLNLLSELDDMEFVHADLESHRFPLHFHDTFVIEQVLTGVDWCSNSEVAATASEIYIHFPYAAHTGGTQGCKRLVYRAIYPSSDLFCRLTGVERQQLPIGATLVSRNRTLINAADRMFSAFERGCSASSCSERELSDVFEQVFEEHQAACSEQIDLHANFRQVSLAREYLLANFERDVTVAELSDVCDLSQYHLIRCFKRQYGITPRQFLISHRVSVAKRMIASGASIAKAAHATGFADQSHLNRCFRKITSFSPRQMKRS